MDTSPVNRYALILHKIPRKVPSEHGTPDSSDWLTEEEDVAQSEDSDSDPEDDESSYDDDSTDSESWLVRSSDISFIDPEMSDYYTSSGDSEAYSPPSDDQSTEGSIDSDTDVSDLELSVE